MSESETFSAEPSADEQPSSDASSPAHAAALHVGPPHATWQPVQPRHAVGRSSSEQAELSASPEEIAPSGDGDVG